MSDFDHAIERLVVRFVARQRLARDLLVDRRPDFFSRPGKRRAPSKAYTRSVSHGQWGPRGDWTYRIHGHGCTMRHAKTGEPIRWVSPDLVRFDPYWFVGRTPRPRTFEIVRPPVTPTDLVPYTYEDVITWIADDASTGWVAALVRTHRVRLLAIARRRGLSPDEAFDCVQEAFCTFLRLPEARALADRPVDALRLLTTVVHNAARTMRKSAVRANARASDATIDALPSESATPDESVADAEARESLRRCVGELSEMQRDVVMLRMLDEMPGDEVAAALGITPQHVAVILHRAKASLRGCMAAAGHCAEMREKGTACDECDPVGR